MSNPDEPKKKKPPQATVAWNPEDMPDLEGDSLPPEEDAPTEEPAARQSQPTMAWSPDDLPDPDDAGLATGSAEDEPEEDPLEAARDAVQTRDAMRDLLNLQTVPEGNGGTTPSSEVLNSGGNGGRYLTPIQKRVYEYSDAGMRVPEIARELGVGKGEIRLILSLRRDRRR